VRAVPAVASDRMSALARSAISRGAAARCRQLSTQANVLQAEIREGDGSRWARKARHQGRIPGILYGPKVVPQASLVSGGKFLVCVASACASFQVASLWMRV